MVSNTIELSTMTVEDSYKGPRMKGNDREGYTLDLEFVQAMLQVRCAAGNTASEGGSWLSVAVFLDIGCGAVCALADVTADSLCTCMVHLLFWSSG